VLDKALMVVVERGAHVERAVDDLVSVIVAG
jgi:hypothetical protein